MAEEDPTVWDARAEVDVGLMIGRYLAERPPPAGSAIAADLEEWGERLSRDGEARLAALQRPRLCPAPPARARGRVPR